MSTALQLANPYLDVFLKYMTHEPAGLMGGWEARSAWQHGDGYNGPLWDRHMVDTMNAHLAKWHLRERMAFAVPNDEAILAIAELEMPVVEVGAGTGYWAWLLEQAGVDVLAYDLHPGDENAYCGSDHWTFVRKGGPAAALRDDRALMLCWPPHSDSMASACLDKYRGDTLVYIGEGAGGCTADDRFFEMLEEGWDQQREVAIPRWEGMHDYLTIYRRRS